MPEPAAPTATYWFGAKRYGWGWGLPLSWQGWAVIAGYTLAITAVGFIDSGHAAWTWPVVGVATALLLLVCVKKGEPARWRWDRDR